MQIQVAIGLPTSSLLTIALSLPNHGKLNQRQGEVPIQTGYQTTVLKLRSLHLQYADSMEKSLDWSTLRRVWSFRGAHPINRAPFLVYADFLKLREIVGSQDSELVIVRECDEKVLPIRGILVVVNDKRASRFQGGQLPSASSIALSNLDILA